MVKLLGADSVAAVKLEDSFLEAGGVVRRAERVGFVVDQMC